jgi:beta-N-acetylhexosaminidase
VSKTWSSNELFPYKELINNNSLNAIMISHLFHNELDNTYPATLSKSIIQDLLRKKMGFEGVVISDDPQMKAISDEYNLETVLELMINAGIDIFCFGNNLIYDPNIVKKVHLIVMKLLDEDKISIDDLQKSYFRVLNMKSIINIS